MTELRRSIGYRFLQETKLVAEKIRYAPRPEISAVNPYKNYPQAEKIPLPRQWDLKNDSLHEILRQRRSRRRYTAAADLSLSDLSFLLWASQGITGRSGNYCFRAAPSAGALYPVETYVAINRSREISPGLFHFDVRNFQLERLSTTVIGQDLATAAMGQNFMAKAGAVFIWSAILRRTMSKYGHRGMRYILMDIGHISQNLLLATGVMGLVSCPVGAFDDDKINNLIGLDGKEETVLAMAPVGELGD